MKPFETLKSKVEKDWKNITGARALSHQKLKELSNIEFFRKTGPGNEHLNIQVVVYGSFAREELTPGSDIDWTLLVDGPADPEHSKIAQRMGSYWKGKVLASHRQMAPLEAWQVAMNSSI